MTGVRHCISGKMESGIIGQDYAKELLRKVDELEKQLAEFPFLEDGKAYEGLVKRIKESAVNKKRRRKTNYLFRCSFLGRRTTAFSYDSRTL